MSEIAIRAERLGKLYSIGPQERYLALRDVLSGAFRRPFSRLLPGARLSTSGKPRESIWALQDVSFEVNRGDVVGIIGRNGAGKSTLLKILSRVTEPTRGVAEIRGRVGSLLEVGTGFHPELTGRENLFLTGAILGMSKTRMHQQFDEIVAFADVERFIDTPVKFYSSGMYIRLAFAVAAYMEPDVLLVDEVLAVGDAEFQKKCLNRMSSIASSGWTVLLVTHNMAVVKAMANTAIWLDKGQVVEIGPPGPIIDKYLSGSQESDATGVFDEEYIERHRVSASQYLNDVVIKSIMVMDDSGRPAASFLEGADVHLQLSLECRRPVEQLHFRAPVTTVEGQLLFECVPNTQFLSLAPGTYEAVIRFNLGQLLPGSFHGEIILSSRLPQDRILAAFQFDVAAAAHPDDDPYMLMYYPEAGSAGSRSEMGLVRMETTWERLPERSGELATSRLLP